MSFLTLDLLIRDLRSLDFREIEWLFPFVLTLHNAEEAIWLPEWSKRVGSWFRPVAPGVFRFAVVVVTLLVYVLTWLSANSGKQSVWTYLVFGSIAVALVNVLIPHLAATIVQRSYMPGVATAVLLNLPVMSLLVVLAVREGYVSGWKSVAYFLAVTGVSAALIPALFKLGNKLGF
jgi:hypothetical protein